MSTFDYQGGASGTLKGRTLYVTQEQREQYWQALPFSIRDAIRYSTKNMGIKAIYIYYKSYGEQDTLREISKLNAYTIAANALRLYGPDHPQANAQLVHQYEAQFTKPQAKAAKPKRRVPTQAELDQLLADL